MDGRLERRKEPAQVLVTQGPSPSLLPWSGKAIANHKTTLMAHASDQTGLGSLRAAWELEAGCTGTRLA